MQVRNSSRAIIVNERNRILLQRFEFKEVIGNRILWVTPGGGLKNSESYSEALERELDEELGIQLKIDSEPVLELNVIIAGKKCAFISHEVYYRIYLSENVEFSFSQMTESERDTFHGMKWWSKEELELVNPDEFAPSQVLDFL